MLVVGQCSHDASVEHVNIDRWYSNTIQTLNEMGENVIFREHPINKKPFRHDGHPIKYTLDKNATLDQTIQQCKAVVTFNSNSGVVALLSGTPAIAMDAGSMAYGIAQNTIHHASFEYTPDRTDWCAKMAYTQWNLDEIKQGAFWKTLKKWD